MTTPLDTSMSLRFLQLLPTVLAPKKNDHTYAITPSHPVQPGFAEKSGSRPKNSLESLVVKVTFNGSSDQLRAPGYLLYLGDDILPSFRGIINSHYEVPFMNQSGFHGMS